MSDSFQPLEPAEPVLDEAGTPYSPRYGDIYHSRWGALRQASSVFLQGNGLPARWRGRSSFTVLETGFGLGMNFLALWDAWRSDPGRSPRLHVVSLEAHPLRADDLRRLHDRLVPAALRALSQALLAAWPPLLPGLHRLEFAGGALTLTLGFGLAQDLARQLAVSVDAYFLDGFAPDRNPQMWAPALLADLARLGAAGATAATWCSAGAVRRGLQAAGFTVSRVAGEGGKHHVTTAVLAPPRPDAQLLARPARAPAPARRRALVVGGGPAGAGVAHALALRGWQVTVLDPALAHGPAGLHAGHVAAAVTPLLARDDSPRARLSRAGSASALARWCTLAGAPVRRCGTLQLARDGGRAADAASALQRLRFPQEWAAPADAAQGRLHAGMAVRGAGVFLADGLLVRPPALLAALLGTPGIECRVQEVASLATAGPGGWVALDRAGGVVASADVAVVANAGGAPALFAASGLSGSLPGLAALRRVAGQVSLLPARDLAGGPRCIVAGGGYLLPAVDGWCVAGSTYEHEAVQAQADDAGVRENLAKAAALCPGIEPAVQAGQPGWAGWRAVLPGRLPMIGPVPDAPGLWVATAYASRGLSWSALAGELIAGALEGEPLPLPRDLAGAIAPR